MELSVKSLRRTVFVLLSTVIPLGAGHAEGTVRYVSPSGDDANPGLTASSPLASPQKAIDAVGASGTVYLLEGDYPLGSTLVVTNGVQVLGTGKETTILRASSPGYPVVRLDNATAVLAEVTITGGENKTSGGGFLLGPKGGTIRDSVIRDNKTTGYQARGGGGVMEGGTLLRCVVKRNRFTSFGNIFAGGIWQQGGLIDNCLITENFAPLTAGGVYRSGGAIRNTTIAGNSALSICGGLYIAGTIHEGDVQNCIITDNHCPRDTSTGGPDWNCWIKGQSCFQNCASPVPIGTNCITAPVAFIDPAKGDYRLRAYSPCVNAGLPIAGGSGLDLAGKTRVSGKSIDIGAYELDESVLSCEISATPARLSPGEEVVLAAHVTGNEDGAPCSCVWTLTAPDGKAETFSGQTVAKGLSTYGAYEVSLSVTCGTETATTERTDLLYVLPAVSYVVVAGTNTPAYPYATPETAANDIATAIAAAKEGSTILVGEGVYDLPAELHIDKPLHLLGPRGFRKTTLRRAAGKKGRVLLLENADATIEGFTLTGARMDEFDQSYGAGVCIGAKGGTLRSCRITGNTADSWHTRGVGLAVIGEKGLASGCIIDHNKAPRDPTGGGAYLHGGLLENCLICHNEATFAGGVQLSDGGSLRNCTITKNVVTGTTGGVSVNGNASSSVLNCLIVGNEAPNDSSAGRPEWGGGNSGAVVRHCHTGEATPVGTEYATGPTDFVDPANDDFHLLASSACIEGGENIEGMAETDLDGSPRLSGDFVDIGCYEYDLDRFSCSFHCPSLEIFSDEQAVFTATISGKGVEASGFEYHWTFSDGLHEPVVMYDESPAIRFPRAGTYSVTLVVSDRDVPSRRASFKRDDYLLVVPRHTYLVTDNPGAAYPYDSWETAATDIHVLVDRAIDGSVIVIGPGRHLIGRTIALDKAITLRGVEGRDKTILARPADAPCFRVLSMNNAGALASGLTITGGHLVNDEIGFGAGVRIGSNGGTLTDCRVTGNIGGNWHCRGSGVGVLGEAGLVRRCIIDNNTATTGLTYGGLAVSRGRAESCLVYSNAMNSCGGIFVKDGGEVWNCTVARNKILPNLAPHQTGAGVAYEGKALVANCIFAENTTPFEGGEGYPEWSGAEEAFDHCAFAGAAPAGTDAVTGSGFFRSPDDLDFRLPAASPCKDKGLFAPWMAGEVDLGGDPRVDHGQLVDIGCYERRYAPPYLILMLR